MRFNKLLFVFVFLLVFFLKADFASANTCELKASGLWSAAGTWTGCGGVAPTASDDVVGTTTSFTLTINGRANASSTARSIDFSMFPGTIIATSTGLLQIGTTTATSTNIALKLGASLTLTASTTAAIHFVSSVATSTLQTITCAGKTLPALLFNSPSGGGYAFIDNCTGGAVTTPKAYEIHFDGLTDNSSLSHSFLSFVQSTNTIPKGVNYGNATITLTGTGVSILSITNSSVFVATSTATFVFTGAAPAVALGTAMDFKGISLTFNATCTGIPAITVNNSIIRNLTRTGAVNRTSGLTTGRITIFDTLTINGDSILNRTNLVSSAVGTASIVSASTTSFSNVDIMDITSAGTGDWDLSGITGGSGNLLGNTGITFTSATTTYWIGGTGNMASTTEWSYSSGGASGARVPLPQDNCIFDSNSFSGTGQTVTLSMPRQCHDIDFSLVGTDNPTITMTSNLSYAFYGSVILDAGMTITNVSGTFIDFRARTSVILDLQGVLLSRPVNFNAPNGTYTFANDLLVINTVTVSAGTTTLGSFGITATSWSVASSVLAKVYAGSGTWTLTGTGSVWNIGSNAFWDGQTATISFVNVTATLKTITYGGTARTYYALSVTGNNFSTGNTGTVIGSLYLYVAGYNGGFRPGSLTTTTITTLFYTNATSTSARALASSTSMTALAELKFTGGTTCGLDYMNFVRILATPPGAWAVGTNSTSTSSSGLTFTYNPCSVSTPPPGIYINGDTYINGNIYLNP